MRNVTTAGRRVSAVLLILLPTAAGAAEPFEGAWVTSAKHCSDKDDRPNSLTVIDLKVALDGKPTPMVEQYENHCRIDKRSTTGNDTTLAVTCFEFWDDFRKKVNARKATIKLSLASKDLLMIDGKRYRRCPEKGAANKSGKEKR
jgi:hypothetical protein